MRGYPAVSNISGIACSLVSCCILQTKILWNGMEGDDQTMHRASDLCLRQDPVLVTLGALKTYTVTAYDVNCQDSLQISVRMHARDAVS